MSDNPVFLYAAAYDSVEDAEADFDAAVIEKEPDADAKALKQKLEQP